MADEPTTITSLLERQITSLEQNLHHRLNATERNVGDRLSQQDKTLERIEQKVDRTNGRVTVLEKARERGLGAASTLKWIPFVLGCLLTGGTGVLLTALLGGFH